MKRPFFLYLLFGVVLLFLVVIASITIIDVIDMETDYSVTIRAFENQTELNTVQTIRIIETGLQIYDASLNLRMNLSFEPFMQEYERSGRDPSRMDLHALKQQLGADTDLYIINESGVIEYATVPSEIGLDFQKTVPYFYDYLTKIRASSGFFPDRAVIETTTGSLRKYAYMPTPDHRYILELGFCDETFQNEWHKLRSIEGHVEDLTTPNSYLESIRVFTAKNYKLLGNGSFVPDTSLIRTLDEVKTKKTEITLDRPDAGKKIKYQYVDVYDERYGSDPSLIVEITYNTSILQRHFEDLILTHSIIALAALIVSIIGAFIISRYLMRPVQKIVDDINIVAHGDLDHAIAPTIGKEFDVLTDSINMMVATLNETIEKLRQSESRSLESETRYRKTASMIFDYAYSAEITPGGKYKLEWSTGAFQKITEYPIEALFARGGLETIVHREDADILADHISYILLNQPFDSEFRIISRTGNIRWISLHTRTEWDSPQNRHVRVYVTGQDITKRKQIELEIRRLNEELELIVSRRTAELEETNKDLESFSYTVSHDLRVPLRAIDGYAVIIMEKYKSVLPPETISYLQKIRHNSEKMAVLIDDLLNFSRLGRRQLRKEMIFLEGLFRSSLEELTKERTGSTLAVNIRDLPPCEGDRAMLKQVCLNLLSNALKFTRIREVAQIDVGSFTEGGHVTYYVKDNGIGFDMQYADKVFEIFQQLHTMEGYEGTGVGLAIVKTIIRRHGGTIRVQSEPDHGTTFFFTLD